MLKIGKGLKKKKKNKKGKGKNDELFTEAELEQYKKDKAEKAVAEEATGKPGASEDFEKFKLLTAGVDDILRKSQGDLDRIKKDSFFQRKPTPSELKALEERERAEREKSEGNWIGFEEGKRANQKVEEAGEESHFEEEDSESEFEDNDDIFDTAYVDALESGEVKLAHIPDDDELGFNDGPDPFDTTTADELLRKAEEEERKKKKEISLGLAVNVLTGRAERDKSLIENSGEQEVKKQVRARPRKIQDFCLLGSFDSEGAPARETGESEPTSAPVDVPKSLLDEEVVVEEDLPEGDVLITEVLVKQVAKPPPPELATPPEGEHLSDLVAEFEFGGPIVDPEIKKLEEEEEFDEFSALAASSIVNQKLEEELQQFELAEDDPFDTSLVNTVLQKEQDPFDSIEGEVKTPISIPQSHHTTTAWSAFDKVPEEVDPFDTAFAEDCAPGKAELRLLEREILDAPTVNPVPKRGDIQWEARILSRNNSEDFNPREGEESAKGHLRQRVSIHITDPSGETQKRGSESEDVTAVTLSQRDLLGGSTTDLSGLAEEVLPLSSTSPSEDLAIRYSDPFDTSLADQATEPGRAELRFIEKELLSDISDILSDEDFDPRAGDEDSLAAQKVSFEIPSPATPDLLSSVREGGGRPLTPYYADPQSVSAESDLDLDLEDPFDTSHVTSLPGKQELKLIEKELSSVPLHNATFQPIHEKLGFVPAPDSSGLKHSVSDENFNPRAEEPSLQVVQPTPRRFSDVSGLNNPPKSLRVRTSYSEDKPDLLAVEEELPDKTLTPAAEEDISSYIDPFDTSIAENIAPGKAELKVLEVELVGSITRSYTDPDFNPRNAAAPVAEGRLKTVPSTKPLTPIDLTEVALEEEEIDPFDTSIATNLAPGRAELRLLESELVTQ